MTNSSTDQQVTDYWLNYRLATDTVRVWIKTAGAGDWILAKEVSPATASFLMGLLAGKQSVYYSPDVSLHSKNIKAPEEAGSS